MVISLSLNASYSCLKVAIMPDVESLALGTGPGTQDEWKHSQTIFIPMQAPSAGVTQGANMGLQPRKEWKGGCEQETQSGAFKLNAFKLIFLVAESFLLKKKKKKVGNP